MLVSTSQRMNGFAVSTAGTLVLLTYDGNVDTISLKPTDGGAERFLYNSATGTGIQNAQLSPDNTQIAFLEGGAAGYDLLVIPTSGAATPRRASPMRASATNLLNAADFSFSPDSRYLAVSGDFTVNTIFELHVFDLSTGVRAALVTATNATTGGGAFEFGWTNTGQVVVRAALNGAPPRLQLCTVTGTCTPLPGTTTTSTVSSLALSPDGTFAVYASNERGVTSAYDLYRVPSAGGTPVRLVADVPTGWRPMADSLVISPNGQWVTTFTTAALYVFSTAGGSPLTQLFVPANTVGIFGPAFSPTSTALAFRSDIVLDGSYDVYRLVDFTTAGQTPILLQYTQGGNISELRWTP